MKWSQSVGVVSALLSLVQASNVKVMVITDGSRTKSENYTKLEAYLGERYGKARFASADAKKAPNLLVDGQSAYNHLIILAANPPYESELIDFINNGGNVAWALEEGVALTPKSRKLCKDLGRLVELQPKPVLDFFSNLKDDQRHIKAHVSNTNVLSMPDIYYRGVSHKIDKSNPLVFPIMSGSGSCANTNGPSGRDNALISGLVGRNDARSVLTGTLEPFLDATFDGKLVEQLLSWTFKKASVQRIDSITPKILSSKVGYFRIRDNFEVEVCLSQLVNGNWIPFQPEDAQIELTMMTPWVRANLGPASNGCLSTGPIQLPDRYGAYSLNFRYQRHGQTHLVSREKLTVLPYKYDQTPRFSKVLWPYYTNWISQFASSLFIVLPILIWSKTSKITHPKKAQ